MNDPTRFPEFPDVVQDRLLEQRRILLSGPLDGDAVTLISAQLMALDGTSSRDVEIVINSAGGPLSEIFPVLDVIGLMRARVNITCIGSARGTAAALVACGSGERRAAPHATFSLRSDSAQSMEGTTTVIVRQAEELTALRARYLEALAMATGQDEQLLSEELDHGRQHSAVEALALGLIDTITGQKGNVE